MERLRKKSAIELPASDLLLRTAAAGGAVFDQSERYRYLLWRDFTGSDGRTLLMVMLNPNNADEVHNDPTIRRCIGFAKSWNFDRLEVVNLFAARAAKPEMLGKFREPVGPYNDDLIADRAEQAQQIILAWGNHGGLHDRDSAVVSILKKHTSHLFCFGTTKTGMPRHPLYIRSQTRPCAFMSGL